MYGHITYISIAMKENLTKREIGTVNAGVLNTRYCWLIKKGDKMPAGIITYGDMRELIWIEDELHGRLIKLIGHDFYPPDRVEKRHPSNYIASVLRSTKPKPEPDIKIKFRATIKSSLGTKVAEVSVEADSKIKADILIRKEIRKLGLKGATYKLS